MYLYEGVRDETPALHQIQYFNPRDSRNPLDVLLPSLQFAPRYNATNAKSGTIQKREIIYIFIITIYIIVNAILILIPFTSFFQM